MQAPRLPEDRPQLQASLRTSSAEENRFWTWALEKFKVTSLSRDSLRPGLTPGVREERDWPGLAQAYVELRWGVGGAQGREAVEGPGPGQSALKAAEEHRPLLNGTLQPFIKITAGPHLGFREFRVKDRAPTLSKKSSSELTILVLLPP